MVFHPAPAFHHAPSSPETPKLSLSFILDDSRPLTPPARSQQLRLPPTQHPVTKERRGNMLLIQRSPPISASEVLIMRLYSVALAVGAGLMANVGRITSFEVTTADYPSIIRSLDHQKGVAPTRLLRRYDADTEERAFGTSTITDLVTKIKGGASKFTGKFKGVEPASKYEAHVMKALQLDRIDDTLTSWKLKDITAKITEFNQQSKTHKVS
ncbi:RxLR effector protein, partial [Phytophthora megakarya]